MTPREIEAILHYYYSPKDLDWGGYELHSWLLKSGWIEIDNDNKFGKFRGTEKLIAYAEYLQSVPDPVCRWVVEMPRKD